MRVLCIVALSLEAALLCGQTSGSETPLLEAVRGVLTIKILDGDDAILNTRQRLGRESIVEVEDENHRPVGGALLTLTSPNSGPGAIFQNGSRFESLFTNDQGQAALRGIRPNQVSGRYSIRITATKEGKSGNAQLHFTNVTPAVAPTAVLSLKTIVAIGAAAAAGAGFALSRSGGGAPQTGLLGIPSAAIALQPGPPTVGPPR
jgi:hypothetical protein